MTGVLIGGNLDTQTFTEKKQCEETDKYNP